MPPNNLRQYRVFFEPVPDSERAVDPNKLGLRSKLGGTPDWVQLDETPNCPSCDAEMRFVGQLDSIEHQSKANPHAKKALSEQQHYMFGDVGLIYIFFCRECSQTQAVVQF